MCGQLAELAQHPVANFVVQAVLASVSSPATVRQMLGQVDAGVAGIPGNRYTASASNPATVRQLLGQVDAGVEGMPENRFMASSTATLGQLLGQRKSQARLG